MSNGFLNSRNDKKTVNWYDPSIDQRKKDLSQLEVGGRNLI